MMVLLSTPRLEDIVKELTQLAIQHVEEYHPPVDNPQLDPSGYCGAINASWPEHCCL